jgi:hypothetical protein
MGHAHRFGARLPGVQPAIDRNLEVFALADIADSAKAKQLTRVFDCLALGIEHAWFQCDVDFGFHAIIFSAAARKIGPARSSKCGTRNITPKHCV